MATYDTTSPYYLTEYSQFFLDVMVNRPIPKQTMTCCSRSTKHINTGQTCWPLTCTKMPNCGGCFINATLTHYKNRRWISNQALQFMCQKLQLYATC